MKTKILIIILVAAAVLSIGYYLFHKLSPELIIDSFEGKIEGGPDATVDYGSGSGAKIDVFPAREPVKHGRQSLKVIYDVSQGGYMWVARGYDLFITTAGQWTIRPEKIKWDEYDAIAFYVYGEESGNDIAFDLIDNGKEYWRFMIKDDCSGWKEVIIPFSEFKARTDWQPDIAQRNDTLDFPVKAFQFEPKTGTGTLFFDKVYLSKKQTKP